MSLRSTARSAKKEGSEIQALVEQAKRDPPAVIFITDEAAMNGFAPVIMNYVHEQYEHRGDFVQMSVYFPKP